MPEITQAQLDRYERTDEWSARMPAISATGHVLGIENDPERALDAWFREVPTVCKPIYDPLVSDGELAACTNDREVEVLALRMTADWLVEKGAPAWVCRILQDRANQEAMLL